MKSLVQLCEFTYAVESLTKLHGYPERANGVSTASVLDSLVRTILSQNTTDKNSRKAYFELKTCFPTWKEVLAASDESVRAAIKIGGLSEIKVVFHIDEGFDKKCIGNAYQDNIKNYSHRAFTALR